METREIIVEGIPFIIPVQLFVGWPDVPLSGFKNCCGAGHGIGDLVVPESIFGVRITPACFIHDYCWDIAQPTWADFHHSNSIFLHNIMAIIQARSGNMFTAALRNYRAITYYNAVDVLGQNIFWSLKDEQGFAAHGQ